MASDFKTPELCTSCIKLGVKYPQVLEEPHVRHCSLSRIDNKTYICNLCGNAEWVAEETGMPLGEARLATGAGTAVPRR